MVVLTCRMVSVQFNDHLSRSIQTGCKDLHLNVRYQHLLPGSRTGTYRDLEQLIKRFLQCGVFLPDAARVRRLALSWTLFSPLGFGRWKPVLNRLAAQIVLDDEIDPHLFAVLIELFDGSEVFHTIVSRISPKQIVFIGKFFQALQFLTRWW